MQIEQERYDDRVTLTSTFVPLGSRIVDSRKRYHTTTVRSSLILVSTCIGQRFSMRKKKEKKQNCDLRFKYTFEKRERLKRVSSAVARADTLASNGTVIKFFHVPLLARVTR